MGDRILSLVSRIAFPTTHLQVIQSTEPIIQYASSKNTKTGHEEDISETKAKAK